MSSLASIYIKYMSIKYYTISKLVEAFNEAGLTVSASWLHRQERKGNLKFERSTTNFKKPVGNRPLAAVRLIKEDQIPDIVKAFLPGGKGFWNYE